MMTSLEHTDWDFFAAWLDELGVGFLPHEPGNPNSRESRPPVENLILGLARSDDARLRDGLVALLVRRPDLAERAAASALSLDADSPVRRSILVSIVVAAALQTEWRFSIDIYLPASVSIQSDPIAYELDLPSAADDFGRAALRAAGDQLREAAPFPFNHEEGWEHAVALLLRQLSREASAYGA